MNDQAATLRAMMMAAPRPQAPGDTPGCPVLVVASGKGGAGKSVVAILLACALARSGKRVLLLDGAQNQGNLHILTGVRPRGQLAALVRGDSGARDLVTPVMDNLWLLPGDSGAEEMHSLTATDRARLHHRLAQLYDEYDAVVVDAGPGIESGVRAAAIRATHLVVVATPEPAALSDAYALIKLVNLQVPGLDIGVLANRTSGPADAQHVFDGLRVAASRFLRRDLRSLGALAEDPAVRNGVLRPPALLQYQAAEVDGIAQRLFALEPANG